MRFLPGPAGTHAKAVRTAREFGELVGTIVNATISPVPVRFVEVEAEAFTGYVAHAPHGAPEPIRLQNDRYLYLHQLLGLRRREGYLTTLEYSYRYQATESPDSWIWRYEYLREPPEPYRYPRCHLHVNARPGSYTGDKAFPDLHLPVGERVTIEAIVRHLIAEQGVDPISPHWETVLAEAEESFAEIQRRRFRD